jgi:hypothetical protein
MSILIPVAIPFVSYIYIRGQFTHSFGIPALMHKDAGHCSGQKWLAGNLAG